MCFRKVPPADHDAGVLALAVVVGIKGDVHETPTGRRKVEPSLIMGLRTGKTAIERFLQLTLQAFFAVDVLHGLADNFFPCQIIGAQKSIVDGLIDTRLIDESHEICRGGNDLLVPLERPERTFALRDICDGSLNCGLPLPCQRSNHHLQGNHRIIDALCIELVTVGH